MLSHSIWDDGCCHKVSGTTVAVTKYLGRRLLLDDGCCHKVSGTTVAVTQYLGRRLLSHSIWDDGCCHKVSGTTVAVTQYLGRRLLSQVSGTTVAVTQFLGRRLLSQSIWNSNFWSHSICDSGNGNTIFKIAQRLKMQRLQKACPYVPTLILFASSFLFKNSLS